MTEPASGAGAEARVSTGASALITVPPLGKLGCVASFGSVGRSAFAGTSCFDASTLTFHQWGRVTDLNTNAVRELEMVGRVDPGISKDLDARQTWTLFDIAMNVGVDGTVYPLDLKQTGSTVSAGSLELALADALGFAVGEAARFRPRSGATAFPTVSGLVPNTPVPVVYESASGTIRGTLTLDTKTTSVPPPWSVAGEGAVRGVLELKMEVAGKKVGAAATLLDVEGKELVVRLGYTDDSCMDRYTDDACMDRYTDDACMDRYTDDSCAFSFLPPAVRLTGNGGGDGVNKFLRFTLTRAGVITGIEWPEVVLGDPADL